MHSARLYIAGLAAAAALGTATPAAADTAPTPLLVIRFGAQPVYFQQALKNAVSRALELKKDAAFTVVLHPGAGLTMGDSNLSGVVNGLRQLGVADGQISSSTAATGSEAFNEVDVFVR